MRQADSALYGAKDGDRGKYQLFVSDLGEAVCERRALEADLRHALASETGLGLVDQPIARCNLTALPARTPWSAGIILCRDAYARKFYQACARARSYRLVRQADQA